MSNVHDIKVYINYFESTGYPYNKHAKVFNSFKSLIEEDKAKGKPIYTGVEIKYLFKCLEVALTHGVTFDASKGLCIMPRGKTVYPYPTVNCQKILIQKQRGEVPQTRVLSKSEVEFIKEQAESGVTKWGERVYSDPTTCLPFHLQVEEPMLKDAHTVIVYLMKEDGSIHNVKTYSARQVMARVGVKIDENGVVWKKTMQGVWLVDTKSVWASDRSSTDPLEMLKSKALSWYLKDFYTLDSECEIIEQKTFEETAPPL